MRYATGGNPGHAAVVDGAFAQQAGAAFDGLANHTRERSGGSGRQVIGSAENGDGWNAGDRLNDATVHDDHTEDVLTGSDGNDWFLFNRDGDGGVKDKVTDLSVFEALYALDLDWLSN